MSILDEPIKPPKHLWAVKHTKTIEFASIAVYAIGIMSSRKGILGSELLIFSGLACLTIVYSVLYPLQVKSKTEANGRWTSNILFISFCALALYVVTVGMSLASYLTWLDGKSISSMLELRMMINIMCRPLIFITFIYALYAWLKIGKEVPEVLTFTKILIPRQILLLIVWFIPH